jgi:hypothetical protein
LRGRKTSGFMIRNVNVIFTGSYRNLNPTDVETAVFLNTFYCLTCYQGINSCFCKKSHVHSQKPGEFYCVITENKNKRLAEELIAGISFECFSDEEHPVINTNETILWPASENISYLKFFQTDIQQFLIHFLFVTDKNVSVVLFQH